MTLYVSTPYGRWLNHRRMLSRWVDENACDEPRARVTFPLNVKAENDGYEITALLPGVISEDINITVVNDVVTIQGEVKGEYDEKATYLLQELPSGKFYRAFSLPEQVDSSKVEASMTNGVLTVRVPKAEEARPKTIKVIAK